MMLPNIELYSTVMKHRFILPKQYRWCNLDKVVLCFINSELESCEDKYFIVNLTFNNFGSGDMR
jgi:hypothetical protein